MPPGGTRSEQDFDLHLVDQADPLFTATFVASVEDLNMWVVGRLELSKIEERKLCGNFLKLFMV
jgi:hypothetical protein